MQWCARQDFDRPPGWRPSRGADHWQV